MTISQKTVWLSVPTENRDQDDDRDADAGIDDVPGRQEDRLAPTCARPASAKAMIEPVKVIAPMATPSDISTSAHGLDRADIADAERGPASSSAAEATRTAARPTERVKAGDELRHLRSWRCRAPTIGADRRRQWRCRRGS
ncbi:MAG: hypothetical protein ACN6I5_03940 [Hyphomicrobiales bacterium]